MGVDILVVTLPRVLVYTTAMLNEAPQPTLRVHSRDWSMLDIRIIPYKVALGVVCLSHISWYAIFATEGPERGIVETTT